MTVVELLDQLRTRDIHVWAEGEVLRYSAPAGSLTEEFSAALRANEGAVLAHLRDVNGVQHTSHYIHMRDGARLAMDVFRPKRSGSVVTRPLPVVWCHDRYQRSVMQAGVITTKLDTRPWLRHLVNHDYVVAVVDARGSGASPGVRSTEFGDDEILDGYDVTEWLAAQPWCTGRVGMFGDSYMGVAQLLTASVAPPHLVAIFPEMVLFDAYDFLYPGGVFRHDFASNWAAGLRERDTQPGVAAVNGHSDLIPSILTEHLSNVDTFALTRTLPYRDSLDSNGDQLYARRSPSSALPRVTASGVAVYLLTGWLDIWVRDALLWFTNLTQPCKIIIGPCHHSDRTGIDLTTEHLRWYDYWLKGIDNGIMAEPRVRYVTVSATQSSWCSSDEWPPADTGPQEFYLAASPQPSDGASVNDGGLDTDLPATVDGADAYTVDYSCTTGRSSRWSNGYGAPFEYDDPAEVTHRSLTYTGQPLPSVLQVTGHPVAHLFVSSTHSDADVFVYLEDVDPTGLARYVTEGVLRASHRALGEAPYRNVGLPYHPSTETVCEPLGSGIAELVFDLHPISYAFQPGHRVRIRITCCDADNAHTPVVTPPPVINIHRGTASPSRVVLPIAAEANGKGR